MKLGELEQHCGNCEVIDLCGEPWSDIMLCANMRIEHVEEKDYLKFACNCKRSNKALEKNCIRSNKAIEKRAEKYFNIEKEKMI